VELASNILHAVPTFLKLNQRLWTYSSHCEPQDMVLTLHQGQIATTS